MKQKDHKALAYFLLDGVRDRHLWKRSWHRRFFLVGCVIPDYIPFTYLRGFRKSRAMRGHNQPYSGEHIRKSMEKLQLGGVNRFRDCFRLGTLMHYLADSFTFPHTVGFEGSMRDHRQYERELHTLFSQYLARLDFKHSLALPMETALSDFLCRSRAEYEKREQGCEGDCRQIVSACAGVFHALCCKSI